MAFCLHESNDFWADELLCAGPLEFLTAIKNAEVVFTDSFHGSIFSTIFEKEFFLFKRFKDTDGDQNQNSRIYHLIAMLGMPNRIFDENNLDAIDQQSRIDFEKAKDSLAPYIEKSEQYLINALNEI